MNHAIHTLEHLTLRAWPALETEVYDGWVLRFSKGYTGRANSVNPLDVSRLPLAEKIAYCEQRYREYGLDVRFRLNTASQPPELDAALAERGYEYFSETDVLTCDLRQFLAADDPRFRYDPALSNDWLRAYTAMNGTPQQHIATLQAMLRRIEAETCFGWVGDAAVGLAVREGDYVGLFDIVVHPATRRQGLGRILVGNLMAWGQMQGAQTAYLQVVTDNAPAQALYAQLGYRLHHKYWYRMRRL